MNIHCAVLHLVEYRKDFRYLQKLLRNNILLIKTWGKALQSLGRVWRGSETKLLILPASDACACMIVKNGWILLVLGGELLEVVWSCAIEGIVCQEQHYAVSVTFERHPVKSSQNRFYLSVLLCVSLCVLWCSGQAEIIIHSSWTVIPYRPLLK